MLGSRFPGVFCFGGDLNLSDQPEVLVRTAGDAPYLSAQSYDTYTGRGWESTVEETFDYPAMDETKFHVVAYDFGVKTNSLREFAKYGCKITVVPAVV